MEKRKKINFELHQLKEEGVAGGSKSATKEALYADRIFSGGEGTVHLMEIEEGGENKRFMFKELDGFRGARYGSEVGLLFDEKNKKKIEGSTRITAESEELGDVVMRHKEIIKERAEATNVLVRHSFASWGRVRSISRRLKRKGVEGFNIPDQVRGLCIEGVPGILTSDLSEGGRKKVLDIKDFLPENEFPEGSISRASDEQKKIVAEKWPMIRKKIENDLSIGLDNGVNLAALGSGPYGGDAWSLVLDEEDRSVEVYLLDIGVTVGLINSMDEGSAYEVRSIALNQESPVTEKSVALDEEELSYYCEDVKQTLGFILDTVEEQL